MIFQRIKDGQKVAVEELIECVLNTVKDVIVKGDYKELE
jgi:hypothetical protein